MKTNRCLEEDWDHSGLSGLQLAERGISSVAEYIANRKERLRQKDELLAYLAQPDVSGTDKGHARCAYLLHNGKLPFQCRHCFLLPGNCVCGRVRKFAPRTKVVISMHPDEWGKGSNTGCLCAASLAGGEMLMRGHKQHDDQLQALLDDPAFTCAMLWPGDDALAPQQLLELAQQRGTRIALIALDGTWDCARKMKSRYPPGLLMLKVPAHLALPDASRQRQQQWEEQQQQQQPEQPLEQRQQQVPLQQQQHTAFDLEAGNAAQNGRVCTLEAVAGALLALEGDVAVHDGLLHALKLKVDAMRRQKHMEEVYGTTAEQGRNGCLPAVSHP
ncbi:DTW domain-containing protein [Scenedesmus sp. NREL 46B-D3]|nr:DTW domain-containing protein [Scenedesmus sp. NREL 46B-D3]